MLVRPGLVVATLAACIAAPVAAQRGGQPQGARDVTVTAIPGVVAANSRWMLAWQGTDNADGIVGTDDGGLLFAQEQPNRISKLDANDKVSVVIEDTHGTGAIAIDAKGLLWTADRENQRIQVFQQDGTFVREIKYKGLPCSLDIGKQYIYMVNGFAGQLVRLDLNGKVLAALGKPGKGPGEFGEAHMIAVNDKGEIYVADSVNAALLKFVKK